MEENSSLAGALHLYKPFTSTKICYTLKGKGEIQKVELQYRFWSTVLIYFYTTLYYYTYPQTLKATFSI